RFSTDLAEGVAHGQVIFIAVGTPSAPDGSADLSGVEAIIREVARLMTCPKVVVIKSTVPVGTGRRMSELMADLTAHPYSVVSNPEFLREGAAVEDFLRPDRIIIGCDGDEDAVQLISELYAPFAQTSQTIMILSRDAAEMVKYASNAYLATRISFVNEIADLCARTGVEVNEVRAGMGADNRIGPDFLNPGVGYGGSCFPKDVQALIRVAQGAGCRFDVLAAVHARNELQKLALAEMVVQRYGKNLAKRVLAVWGLAFKPNTDDVREAPAIYVVRLLHQAGAHLRCYDPKASANAAAELADCRGVEFATDPYDALNGADGLIICTEWNEFRTPDFDRIRTRLKERVIFDGRNLYDPRTMIRQRIEYHSIGRATANPAHSHIPGSPRYG
ncbi:MAG: UDP-glucose/GDP-mannose dehydrogenase family protein, partial [Phycisphaerae bacterium]|nr:UDP-glucose/GDP-mannose dehydrogenase family protein [Phycisphaerae bacterium]